MVDDDPTIVVQYKQQGKETPITSPFRISGVKVVWAFRNKVKERVCTVQERSSENKILIVVSSKAVPLVSGLYKSGIGG